MKIFNADCLEEMKNIDDDSIDLIFCDLPYGQTSCKWDIIVPWDPFWKEIMRIKKLNTPVFFTTTTKFGVQIINNAPKKMPFRYDLIWVKSASAGFLSAKKMPLRKHEMIYVFYEKLPFYNLESHTHKFIKSHDKKEIGGLYSDKIKRVDGKKGKYDPPLPVSVVGEGLEKGQTLGDKGNECYGKFSYYNNGVKGYDPPLPVSVVKEDNNKDYSVDVKDSAYGSLKIKQPKTSGPRWDPPLPDSVVKEPEPEPEPKIIKDTKHGTNTYDTEKRKKPILRLSDKQQYEPPLPTSVVKEKSQISKPKEKDLYGDMQGGTIGAVHGVNYEPPLPVSVVKEDMTGVDAKTLYGDFSLNQPANDDGSRSNYRGKFYEPPLPTSMLEVKSTRGKHSTEKPVALIEWILKYYSKEGDVILDPTMGSGSTGVACKNMNREFIGIEKDEEIFKFAENRLN